MLVLRRASLRFSTKLNSALIGCPRSTRWHATTPEEELGETCSVTFVSPDGEKTVCTARENQTLLEIAKDNEVPLEGACEAAVACSTCHVILPEDQFEELEELFPLSDREEDMLDLAPGVTDFSRLGCQVRLKKCVEGMEVKLPAYTRNFAVDGFVPQSH
eukprot:TRINITY_DN67850_c9_g2_i1.p1 TRINITY_DN67850_c9_g2~~TRINITY_DN67850_c9_g2_i1.p1  ORF type:complete len:160 (+),score=13.30 TRINITY_DN67850_c9_g2_i1:42-521(+)